MLSKLFMLLAAALLVGLAVANLGANTIAAIVVLWWLLGCLVTRWAWAVFVGQDRSSAWKWGWAVALGGAWPLWATLAALALAGEAASAGDEGAGKGGCP
ncbi:MAG: hypothetical protein C4525_03080 [Desulfarculus sp.]|jgi:hypothetical protein|nr:MAG: hypothetical protein C4525_03080 [Desulfarculus sp.]